ncbi:MAG: 2-polyprenyl-3-methyl-5-hydroxy-6-metoxy-1,4-benzoquinol methylase [Oleiphilaceae bacterium]|jgi:2-polyprenyl-3-methyl-5-hydroxy-6-metoxy-1,4-benzoquinol methylase
MKKGSYLQEVRNQYENYPYPARDPEDEKGMIVSSRSSSLDCLNYYCFDGGRDFSKPFRVLVAGGGTGDCLIYLAEQLRDTPAEVVYLDMSKASMNIAKARAKVRNLSNIKWVHESLLNLPESDLGKFDFITCSGVLHHLDDPQEGLDALTSVLHPDGSIFLMLYAQHGRTSIYQMQDLLNRVHADEPDIQKKIDRTRLLLNSLPEGNWFNFNSGAYGLDLQSDIGLYDLLLHPQDRAYTVPELYDYVEKSGLTVNKLFNPDHPLGDMLFEPETFIRDKETLEGVKRQSFREQAAICELMFGQLMKQCCFISFKDKATPSSLDLDLIPSISTSSSRQANYNGLSSAFLSDSKSIRINPFVSFNRSRFAAEIFKAIDGKRSSREIIDFVFKNSDKKVDVKIIENQYMSIVDILIKVSMAYLRKVNLKPYETIPEILVKMNDIYGENICKKAYQEYLVKIQR